MWQHPQMLRNLRALNSQAFTTVIFYSLCGLAQEMRLNESQSFLGITGELVSLLSGSYLLDVHSMTRIPFE